VNIEKLLEVEICELVGGRHPQQSTKLGIRVDVMLVLQVVLLHVGGHVLGDV